MTSVTLATLAVHSILGYVDPGSGSYFFQLLIAGFSAAALLWQRVGTAIRRALKRPADEDSPRDQEPPNS